MKLVGGRKEGKGCGVFSWNPIQVSATRLYTRVRPGDSIVRNLHNAYVYGRHLPTGRGSPFPLPTDFTRGFCVGTLRDQVVFLIFNEVRSRHRDHTTAPQRVKP